METTDILKEIQSFKMSVMAESKTLFAETIANSVNAIIVSTEGTILYSTPNLNNLFGYLEGELDGHNILDIMPEEFRERHKEHLAHFWEHPKNRNMGESTKGLTFQGQHKYDGVFPLAIELHPKILAGQKVVVAIVLKKP